MSVVGRGFLLFPVGARLQRVTQVIKQRFGEFVKALTFCGLCIKVQLIELLKQQQGLRFDEFRHVEGAQLLAGQAHGVLRFFCTIRVQKMPQNGAFVTYLRSVSPSFMWLHSHAYPSKSLYAFLAGFQGEGRGFCGSGRKIALSAF